MEAYEALEKMLFLRRFEERVLELFQEGAFQGHYHVYIGEEATAVGALSAWPKEDYMYTTHRSHGHILARGADPVAVMAEILGRSGGLVGGRGGSYHIAWPEGGVPMTSALVAGNIPQAAGTALAAKRLGTGRAVLCWFGDGAVEEGAFYETMNLAALWKLPVLFLCENNSVPPQYRAMGQYPSSTHAAPSLHEVVLPFRIESHVVDGTDHEAVAALVEDLQARLHAGEGPFFVEARTSRWPGSYGLWPELVGGRFRIEWVWAPETAPPEVREWTSTSDPIVLLARRLLGEGRTSQEELRALDAATSARVDEVVAKAKASPYPPPEHAFRHVFVEEGS